MSIEYLRGTGSAVDRRVGQLVAAGAPLSVTEPIALELLAGARDEARAQSLRRMILSLDLRPTAGLGDAEEAARIFRACRRAGRPVRSLTDCLIAAVALREGLAVLSSDRDFEWIAEVTGLALEGRAPE